MTGFYDAQVREQLREAQDKISHLEDVVRFLIEDSAQTETARARFLGAWQSTIVEARRQHARAEAAEAELAQWRAAAEVPLLPTLEGERDDARQQLRAAETGMRLAEQLLAKAQDERETYRAAWHSAKDRARKQHARAERAEARIAAVRALAADWRTRGPLGAPIADQLDAALNDPVAPEQSAAEPCAGRAGFCHACRTLHSVPQFGPTILPKPVEPPTLAAMAQLAERAHAEHVADHRRLQEAICTAGASAGLTVLVVEPVQEIAGGPAALDLLVLVTLAVGMPGLDVAAVALPLVPDDSLPAGEVHLRPHPRTMHPRPS